MQRARGLAALLDVARQSGMRSSPWSSEAAYQQAAVAWGGPLAAPSTLWSFPSFAWGASDCQLGGAAASAVCRGLHNTTAVAAATDKALPAAAPAAASAAGSSAATVGKQVLYKGRGMRLFRVLVRLKVFQLAGIAALAVPINTFLATGSVSGTQAVMASALVVGAGVASTALWYYSRRYVGELSLLPGAAGQPPRVRLSVLDFWGNREDNDIALQALIPPLQHLPEGARRAALLEPLLPVDVEGDRQYFLSLRYGTVVDGTTLKALLAGQLEGQQLPAHDE